MADGLVIRIGADVTPAVQGLQQVEQRMRLTVAAGQSFGKGIDKSVQSLSKLPGSSNQATQSLINLSRVDRKSTRLNSSHSAKSRMPSSA